VPRPGGSNPFSGVVRHTQEVLNCDRCRIELAQSEGDGGCGFGGRVGGLPIDGARFSFDEEPGEYRWILTAIHGGGLALKILEFPQLWGEKPDAEGRIVLDATCQVRVFGEAVLVSLNRLLEEHGLKGYRQIWSNAEFPVEDYRVLCSNLGSIPASVIAAVGSLSRH